MPPALNRILPIAAIPILLLALAAAAAEKPGPPATEPSASAWKSPVFEDLDQFRRIVIVWEGSGSVINKMGAMKYQFSSAFESLSLDQSFNLISLRDKTFDPIGKELLPATAENKKTAAVYVREMTTTGSTDPIPGLEEAFREKPDVIYIMDNGDLADNDAVAKKIAELNKDHKTKIYTVALTEPGDTDLGFIAFFEKLAADGNGKFKRVDLRSLE